MNRVSVSTLDLIRFEKILESEQHFIIRIPFLGNKSDGVTLFM